MGPQGYSITHPHLTDVQHRQWLDLREMLATGWGVKRKKMLIKRVQDVAPRFQDGPLIAMTSEDWFRRYGSHSEGAEFVKFIGNRRVFTLLSDEETEIDMGHYRKVQALRSSLERRVVVPGHTFAHVPLFGPNRFRPRVETYDFPDNDPFFSRPTQSATRWNEYKLGKAIRT